MAAHERGRNTRVNSGKVETREMIGMPVLLFVFRDGKYSLYSLYALGLFSRKLGPIQSADVEKETLDVCLYPSLACWGMDK